MRAAERTGREIDLVVGSCADLWTSRHRSATAPSRRPLPAASRRAVCFGASAYWPAAAAPLVRRSGSAPMARRPQRDFFRRRFRAALGLLLLPRRRRLRLPDSCFFSAGGETVAAARFAGGVGAADGDRRHLVTLGAVPERAPAPLPCRFRCRRRQGFVASPAAPARRRLCGVGRRRRRGGGDLRATAGASEFRLRHRGLGAGGAIACKFWPGAQLLVGVLGVLPVRDRGSARIFSRSALVMAFSGGSGTLARLGYGSLLPSATFLALAA